MRTRYRAVKLNVFPNNTIVIATATTTASAATSTRISFTAVQVAAALLCDGVARVLPPLREKQLPRSRRRRRVHHNNACGAPSVALSSGLESVGECCAAAQLRRNHLLPVTHSHVRGGGADCGMQLLRFALVQRRHARLNENGALPRNRLDDLEA